MYWLKIWKEFGWVSDLGNLVSFAQLLCSVYWLHSQVGFLLTRKKAVVVSSCMVTHYSIWEIMYEHLSFKLEQPPFFVGFDIVSHEEKFRFGSSLWLKMDSHPTASFGASPVRDFWSWSSLWIEEGTFIFALFPNQLYGRWFYLTLKGQMISHNKQIFIIYSLGAIIFTLSIYP